MRTIFITLYFYASVKLEGKMLHPFTKRACCKPNTGTQYIYDAEVVWIEHLFLIITKEKEEVHLSQQLRTARLSVGLDSTGGENNGGLRL